MTLHSAPGYPATWLLWIDIRWDDLDKVQGSLPGQGDGEEDEAGGCGHDGGLGWSELSPSHRYLLSVLKPEIWDRDYIKQYLETLAFNIAYYETKASQKTKV